MKAIRYTLPILLTCLAFSSCQEVEEPMNTVPVVTTDEVEKNSQNIAHLSGTVSSRAECYFLVSTSEDLSDAQIIEAGTYWIEESEIWISYSYIEGLISGTTYYVALCATDGHSEVRGNVVSFATLSSLSIESATFNGESAGDIVGFYLVNSNQRIISHYGNIQAKKYGNHVYLFDGPISITEPSTVFAYNPYNANNSIESLNEIEVQTDAKTNYLYGSCDVTPSNPKANIKMRSALTTLCLIFSTDYEGSITLSNINLRNVNQESETEALSIKGKLDLITGEITPTPIRGHDGILVDGNHTINAGKTAMAYVQVIPTSFNNEEIVLYVSINGELSSILIPGATWKAGEAYEIPLTVIKN